MTYDELLYQVRLKRDLRLHNGIDYVAWEALRAVVELHKPYEAHFGDVISQVQCRDCEVKYPCPTIQAIEQELM